MPATYDDAKLVVQLLSWGTQMGLPEAVSAVLADDFDPDRASANDSDVRALLSFGETIGTFVKHDVLDRAFADDLWWMQGTWAKVGPAALRLRERLGEPRLYENFEALAGGSVSST
jgi:hypothetical protein